jgi:hypothetical protein
MGGAAGHMAHLHENIWLTIGEIKSFLTQVASAEMSPMEKVDGQNIFFRWTPSGIMTARNGGDLKKGGMTEAEYYAKWEGHPAGDAFIQGFEIIKSALSKLGAEEATSIFEAAQPNSYRFCNCEIMFPENENLIVYDGNYIVLHNLKEYAITPKLIETEVFMSGDSEFDSLISAVADAEKIEDSKDWQVFGPKFIELKALADNSHLDNAISAIDSLGYSEDQPLFQMVKDRLVPELQAADIPKDKITKLLNRIKMIGEGADSSELTSIADIKGGLTKEQKSAVTKYGSVQKAKKLIGEVTNPLAIIISDFAIEVLRGLESFFVTDSDGEIARIQSVLQDSIEKLEAYEGEDAEKMGEMLEKQLSKLGPVENIASTMEGVIFEYPPGSKNLVKLTGSFAMANQIIGKAKRIPDEEAEETESLNAGRSIYTFDEMQKLYEAIDTQDFDSVAIIGGAFKPPHLGHVSMVDHYSALADSVKVIISDPKSDKSQRFCGSTCLTAGMSLQLWNLLLGSRPNVTVEISSAPSPIAVAYDSVMPGHPWEPGTTVYLGASVKGGDINRFAGAVKKADPNINVPSPDANAAPAAQLPGAYIAKLEASPYKLQMPSFKKGLDPQDYSASDLRFLLEKAVDPVAKELAGYFVGAQNVDAYASAIGLIQESKRYDLLNAMFGTV